MTHTKDENCIFCKIIDGKINNYKIYEDEDLFGFLTIRPHVKGHMLLIPKNHSEEFLQMDEDTYKKLFIQAKRISEKMKQIFNAPRVSLVTMGFGVNHTHLHILPIHKETDLNTDMAYNASTEELLETQKLFDL